jgi:hypothetical protein
MLYAQETEFVLTKILDYDAEKHVSKLMKYRILEQELTDEH